MESLPPDNPAARLFNVLNRLSAPPSAGRFIDILCDFVYGQDCEPTLMERQRAIAQLHNLPTSLHRSVKILNLSPTIFLGWIEPLHHLLITINWYSYPTEDFNLKANTLINNLGLIAHTLANSDREKMISEEEISSLKDTSYTLFGSISDSSLAPEVRKYLLKHIDQIIQALEDYQLSGIGPIELATEHAIASVAKDPNLAKQSKDSEVGLEFWRFIGRLAISIEILDKLKAIGNEVASFFVSVADN